MTTRDNIHRRLSWLWKHRHTHDDDTLQQQITVIRETVETQTDVVAGSASGTYIHLSAVAQTLTAGGEALEWAEVNALGLYEFTSPTFPATSITIPVPGYYNVAVAFDWDTFTGGGEVWIVRTRNGLSETVYPVAADPGVWDSSLGSMFVETAHAISLLQGDELAVWVDPGASNQDIVTATLDLYLVDRIDRAIVASADPGLVDAVASHDADIATTHQITMTTAQTSGDLMLMLLVSQTSTWSAYPSGWTALVNNFQYGVSAQFFSILYKVSDGTETDVTADTSGSNKTSHAVWVVQSAVDYSTNAPTAATPIKVAPAGHPTIDPPAVTPSQGAGNYMIFPLVGRNGGGVQVSDGPDGYDMAVNTYDTATSGSSGPALEVFQAALAVAVSVDPSSITWETTWTGEVLGSTTIAVRI